ncbi:sensor histidine kinase [Nocardioides yefusunii]|uniref:Sensor histidine kinase n=1 Tax=Nocardioides yefusunii TaxID=2500546 RepID=A0ABW1QWZ7_9ACTN|nr:histidine kinase [Nocardioides yefusunii]
MNPPPSAVGARLLRLVGWSRRTDVERVRRYTEISLHSMHWFFVVLYGAASLETAQGRVSAVVTLGVLVALGLLSSRGVRYALTRWDRRGVDLTAPAVWQLLAAFTVGTAWGISLDSEERLAYSLVLAVSLSWGLGGLRARGWLAAVLVMTGISALFVTQTWHLAGASTLFAAFMFFTVQSSLWLLGVVVELDRARTVQAELAVARERLRFAGDVHDVMGRHLSVIAVQSEVAAAMVERGDDRAGEKIRLVRASAHDALREARELARGYRPLDLAQEIRGAVSLLASAGVRTDGDVEEVAAHVPVHLHDPAARVVREAITNVIRHSRATRVTFACGERSLSVSNDGLLPGSGSGDGSGVATLRRSVEQFGGTLVAGVVEGTDDGGADAAAFVVTLTWP